MFSEVKTYAPDDVYLTFGGYTVEGWNSITLKKRISEFRLIQGIRGKNTRVRNINTHATIEINVDMTSDLNQILSSIVSKDIATGGAVLYLSLIDKSGTEQFSSNEAYVSGEADRTYDSTLSARVWTIECLNSRFNDGGNAANNTSIFDMIGSLF